MANLAFVVAATATFTYDSLTHYFLHGMTAANFTSLKVTHWLTVSEPYDCSSKWALRRTEDFLKTA